MPVTPTYPGIYIEELPSNARTITPAPTSITVFIGYTHPFKTRAFHRAVQLFSFADYEREFGGFFTSNLVADNVAQAINQFYLNGGSDAWVVGLPAQYRNAAGGVLTVAPPAGVTTPAGVFQPGWAAINSIAFTAREPTDNVQMQVTINNINSALDTADIIITYGTRSETFRAVTVSGTPASTPNHIDNLIGTAANPVSSLVTVHSVGADYTTPIASPVAPNTSVTEAVKSVPAMPPNLSTTFNANDFTNVFKEDGSLDKDVPIFNLLTIPGVSDNAIWSAGLTFCERKLAFAIMDPPAQALASADPLSKLPWIGDAMDTVIPKSANGALYFPYLKASTAPELPPSGYVAGIYAKTDQNRGVWKAPAGLETTLRGTTGVVQRGRMNDKRHGTLNPKGINVLRDFSDSGTVVFGARTLVAANPAFEQWRYVPVRRTALFIEQSLYNSLGWVVFEPNDEPLWVAIRTTVENFMLSLFNQNAFQGRTPSQAFLVKCDSSTTTQTDIDLGIVNILVGFRPLKPAEFVIIKIAQLAGQVQA
jgi:uncharacterized protein